MANELYKGSQEIKELYFGGTKIDNVYRGSTLVYQSCPYEAGQVLFESATPGTYTLNLLANGIYKVWIVGGGAGAYTNEGARWNKSGGGSGAAFVGTVNLVKSSYNLTVGGGGAGGGRYPGSGGNSSIGNIIVAGGGGGGYNGGVAGILTINTSVISSEIQSNGNTGGYGSGTNYRGGGASLYGGYGAGGSSPGGTTIGNPGTGGYVKIQFVSL